MPAGTNPNGFAAISRGLSAAMPPVWNGADGYATLKGS